MNSLSNSLSIHFSPMLPISMLALIALLVGVFTLYGLWRRKKGTLYRLIVAAAFMLIIANPSLLEEKRKPVKDVAIILVDKSPSQKMQNRESRTEKALASLQTQLGSRDDLELRIIEAPKEALATETLLFEALERSIADVPPKRRAGVIIISDGQIHDVPSAESISNDFGPLHILLTGEKNEIDRHIKITQSPAYGIVGQEIKIHLLVEDTGIRTKNTPVRVTMRNNNQQEEYMILETGREHTLEFEIENAGQNIFEFSVEGLNGEITQNNNRVATVINGVRDRLRVLLVSGQPHTGGRTWRDLLTSDPSVDLIHFTILREPNKLDATPQKELSLIAFPFRELFEIKLYDFDLIIFDRYKLNRILPSYYFNNIVRYVKEGGALMMASGPDYAGENSVYFTSLMEILPATPSGDVIKEKFYPRINALGKQHPVTNSLIWNTEIQNEPGHATGQNPHGWGPWLRQVSLDDASGQVLMEGVESNPLLILKRVEDGRIAQIASDHLWLWSRGYEGGGPHTELMRRIVHWLMKEPQLDERALSIQASGDEILIKTIDIENKNSTVTMIKPDGTHDAIAMERREDNILQARIRADQLGVYTFEDGYGESRFISIGELNPKELQSVLTSDESLQPLLRRTGGGSLWLEDYPDAPVRMINKNRRSYAGHSWIGLQQNNEYTIEGIKERSLLPFWAGLILLLSTLALTWWREGKAS